MIRVRQVKVSILEDDNLFLKVSNKLGCKSKDIKSINIIKKSIDARDKNNIYYVYEVDVDVFGESNLLKKNKNNDIFKSSEVKYVFPECKNKDKKVIVVGSGPAGLFCAYMLASSGISVLVIEQGEMVEERVKSVEEFFKTNKLNVNSNIQFGEGGAGTFSDGKLNTLVKDKEGIGRRVFEIFVENGAPEEILYIQKPHIGTDILRRVIVNIRNKIIAMGGEFLFNTKMTDINIINGKVRGIIVNNNRELLCDDLVLAIGHSARDTFYMLNDKNISMKSKNFAVGLRIEHNVEMIDKSQYGKYYKYLDHASYKLTHKCSNGRGVYTFCMCPGGYVVNASSEDGRLVVNGMSNYRRDSLGSNSAVVVTVNDKDFGNSLFGGLEFQRKLEEEAYSLGSGNIPIQLVKDFFDNRESTSLGSITPHVMGKYSFSNLNELFSSEIVDSLKEGILAFDKKIKGFASDDAVLFGVESRTSSPITIERDSDMMSNIDGIYPCGEGAGYAGGITTSCIDGVRVAEKIACK